MVLSSLLELKLMECGEGQLNTSLVLALKSPLLPWSS